VIRSKRRREGDRKRIVVRRFVTFANCDLPPRRNLTFLAPTPEKKERAQRHFGWFGSDAGQIEVAGSRDDDLRSERLH